MSTKRWIGWLKRIHSHWIGFYCNTYNFILFIEFCIFIELCCSANEWNWFIPNIYKDPAIPFSQVLNKQLKWKKICEPKIFHLIGNFQPWSTSISATQFCFFWNWNRRREIIESFRGIFFTGMIHDIAVTVFQ